MNMTMQNGLPASFINVEANIENIRILFLLKNGFYFVGNNPNLFFA